MIKNKLLIVLSVFTVQKAFAQLPVSTTPENKNVILEEFTGIYCGFCPDGHVVADGIVSNNPDDVFVINIHTGSFASPSSGDPDFRTPFGSDIASQSDLAGYPAGTVNRHLFTGMSMNSGTAMSRGDWASAASTILGEPSYVNIALEGNLDATTRELIVDVEMYVTGTAPSTFNLNVALLQDHVEGPQSGGANFNPSSVLPNGNYDHKHMLRHLLSGQWGTVINATPGTVITQQYTYTIPPDLNGVSYELGNLDLVAFIAEGQQEIVTGNTGPINVILPNGIDNIDVAASTNMTFPNGLCDYNVTPEVTITNNGNDVLDTMEVSYTLNGGTPITEMVYQSINGGQSYTHSFNPITVSAGANKITYDVNTDDDLSSLDISLGNNSTVSAEWYNVSATAFATSHTEGFESNVGGDVAPANAIAMNPDGIEARVLNQASGFGNSTNSFFWNFFSISDGKESSLVWEKIDFSSTTGAELTFSHAYAQYTSEDDQLEILISTDCGATWTSVWMQAGSQLATASASTSSFFPTASQWAANTVDLSAYDGESEVMVRFSGTSNYGNNLFIDDINIGAASGPNGIPSFENDLVQLYPNPVSDVLIVDVDAQLVNVKAIKIINLLGEIVYSYDLPSLNGGINSIDVSNLKNGVYHFILESEEKQVAKKFSVQH